MGDWTIPETLRHLPSSICVHTAQPIDFASLRGKQIAVIGAGASAFDNAATALEAGAAEVHLFCRRADIQVIQPYRWLTFRGFLTIFVTWMTLGAGASCAPFSRCGKVFRKRPTVAVLDTPIFTGMMARRSKPPGKQVVASNCRRRGACSLLIS
jgi:hypothetical protein